MKHLDEFRDPILARRLVDEIRRTVSQQRVLMEVCGGQTHSLLRHGIAVELEDIVELIHGPGCPVCVTPAEAIDFAQQLALEPNVSVASFGDMLRVPGSSRSLLDARSQGGTVKIVYSPLDAVELAKSNPDQHIVFFAVGFETTAPTTALAVLQAAGLGLENFSLLVSHVRVLPAMDALMQTPECRVEGFLAAGHVCTVTGFDEYENFVERYKTPVVVTGFEPLDLLDGILDCVTQLETGRSTVTNRYARSVQQGGNASAQEIVHKVYEIADTTWRGMGVIPQGGYRLRDEFSQFDATHRFHSLQQPKGTEAECPTFNAFDVWGSCPSGVCASDECRSGEVLTGLIKPFECDAFGTSCSPDSPLGAPMVSAEGACAAYFKYQRTV
ncbi:MAG: hydrogenase formation protein HypD [Planctomycetaceae bacterium]|nr:hydrogenase formation protein HypD [Planctomycetaceae bacterium]